MAHIDEFGRSRPNEELSVDARSLIPQRPPRGRHDSDLSNGRGGGGRGRRSSRSPGYDRGGGHPRDRDRPAYRETYGDDNGASRGGGRGGRRGSVLTTDPMLLDYLIDWKTFAQWLRDTNELGERPQDREEDAQQYSEIMSRYEAYKSQWVRGFQRKFFLAHEGEDWLVEKYHPELKATVRGAFVAEMKRRLYQKFVEQDLPSGKYDAIDLDALPDEDPATMVGTLPPFIADRADAHLRTVHIKSVPLHVKRLELLAFFQPLPGFAYLTLSEPRVPSTTDRAGPSGHYNAASQHFALGPRTAWVVFNSPADAEGALARVREVQDQLTTAKTAAAAALSTATEISTASMDVDAAAAAASGAAPEAKVLYNLTVSIPLSPPPKCRVTVVDAFTKLERMAIDWERVLMAAQHLDAEYGFQGVELLQEKYPDAAGKVGLDKLIMYLRNVHLYCYYSAGMEAESPEELLWKCGDIVYRRQPRAIPAAAAVNPTDMGTNPNESAAIGAEVSDAMDVATTAPAAALSGASVAASERHAERTAQLLAKFDAKIAQRFTPPTTPVDMAPLGALTDEQAVDLTMQKRAKREQEGRYRCMFEGCEKLFKDVGFVVKHIKNKHADLIVGETAAVVGHNQYINAFLLDPHHLMPRDPSGHQGTIGGFSATMPFRLPGEPPLDTRGRRGAGPDYRNNGGAEYRGGQDRSNGGLIPSRPGGPLPDPRSRYGPHSPRDYAGSVGGPPPPDAREQDPRALKYYNDLDAPVENDVVLDYD
ncbi:hypothetical protein BC828DRAFT_403554 [Blastocladiella britannica]|nr:hypothetical protein BC828DRAFT_403554 [Blastocladiella britannica]